MTDNQKKGIAMPYTPGRCDACLRRIPRSQVLCQQCKQEWDEEVPTEATTAAYMEYIRHRRSRAVHLLLAQILTDSTTTPDAPAWDPP